MNGANKATRVVKVRAIKWPYLRLRSITTMVNYGVLRFNQ
jgi:hypothetical protein